MEEPLEDALVEVIDRIEAGGSVDEPWLRDRFPGVWREIAEALAVESAIRDAPSPSLGAYELGHLIGRGGMGTLYRARKAGSDTVFALKVIHRELLEDPRVRRRFLQEAELGCRIRHENVIRVHELGREDREGEITIWIVMDFVEGPTLRGWMQEQDTIPETRIRDLGIQAARGLHAVHSAGGIHRDVKPENFILTTGDRLVLTDLGLARLRLAHAPRTTWNRFLGNLLYAAPEQFLRQPIRESTDVYALGLVLHEMAAGVHPFARCGPMELMQGHLEGQVPDLRVLRPDLSPDLVAAIERLHAKEPDDRPADGGAAAMLLRV